MHLFSYTILILINTPEALQFTAHKNDVLMKQMWGNFLKFKCPKAGLGVILKKISNNYENVEGSVYLKGGVY